MSNEDDDKCLLSESNDEFTTTTDILSPAESKSFLQEYDSNRSMPAPKVYSPVKRMSVPAGRKLQDIDPSLSGSVDFSGESKQKIPHHRVDDLSQLEDAYDIGKKLGQ